MEAFVVVICLINAVSAISSVISNAFVFLAILRTPSLHIPSNILLCSLAVSDFGVGLFVQPLFISYVTISSGCEYKEPIKDLFRALALFFCAVSATTLVAISLDRYLALYLHVRYYALVTIKRTRVFLCVLWLIYTTWLPVWSYSTRKITSAVVLPSASLYIITSSFCYIKIFQIVRRHRRQIAVQFNSVNVPFPRRGKSITTSMYIHGLFIICMVPVLIANGVSIASENTHIVRYLLYVSWSIVCINSSLNPFLYCYRMRDIRKVVVFMAKSCFCWERPQLNSN